MPIPRYLFIITILSLLLVSGCVSEQPQQTEERKEPPLPPPIPPITGDVAAFDSITGLATHPNFPNFAQNESMEGITDQYTFTDASDSQTIPLIIKDDFIYQHAYISYGNNPGWTEIQLQGNLGTHYISNPGTATASIDIDPSLFGLIQPGQSESDNYLVVYTCDSNFQCHGGWQIHNFTATLQESQPQIGLVSHYAFEGNANDEQGINHGELKGHADIWNDPDKGNVLTLDGDDDNVSIPDSSSLDITNEITLSAWVNLDIFRSYEKIFIKPTPGIVNPWEYYAMDVNSDGAVRFILSNGTLHEYGGWQSVVSSSPITLNEWHHVVGTYDGSTMRLYIDGVEAGTPNQVSLTIATNDENLMLGLSLDGMMDDMMIYDDALTPAEVQSLYSSQRPVVDPCQDGSQNGDEGGVDCGGSCPNNCCSNGVMDDDETGVDCGGTHCQPDCCSNEYMDSNLNETGVDCGGPCPDACYEGTTYYVSSNDPNADDSLSNDGTNPSVPWETISRVNSETFQAGDAILFKRGDTFREEVTVPSSGEAGNHITFGNYGNPADSKPRILGSDISTGWVLASGYSNVWRTTDTFSDPRAGTFAKGEVFFEEQDDSVSWGTHCDSVNELVAEYNWTWQSDGYIYVNSTGNPDTLYNSVEIPQRRNAFYMDNQQYITIDGIDMFYQISAGVMEKYRGRATSDAQRELDLHGFILRNSEMAYMCEKEGSDGYGSAVIYSNTLIENNYIHDVGRRGISFWNYARVTVGNVTIQHNTFHSNHHTTGIDVGLDPEFSDAGGLENFIIRNNLFYEEEYGQDWDTVFVQLITRDIDNTLRNVTIYNNIFKYPMYAAVTTFPHAQDIYIYNNVFYGFHKLSSGTLQHMGFSHRPENHVEFKNNIFYDDFSTAGSILQVNGDHPDRALMIDMVVDYNLYYNVGTDWIYRQLTPRLRYEADKFFDTSTGDPPPGSPQYDVGWDWNSPLPADPMFEDPRNNDFRLRAGSPAIDAGTAIPGIVEHDGADLVDIGLFDFDVGAPRPPTGAIIADHNAVISFDNGDIPSCWIEEVKTMFHLYPGQSHSGWITALNTLESQDSTYAYNYNAPSPGEHWISQNLVGHCSSYCGEEHIWTTPAATNNVIQSIQTLKDQGNAPDTFGWGWCWDTVGSSASAVDPVYQTSWHGQTNGGPEGSRAWGLEAEDTTLTGNSLSLQDYLDALEQIQLAHPDVNITYQTSPVDTYTGESGYQRYLKHEGIREYVQDNGLNIFDYADILTHNEAGNQYFLTWTDHQNVEKQYAHIHPDNLGGTSVAHIGSVGALRLAKAHWWLMARLAGWSGVAGDTAACS